VRRPYLWLLGGVAALALVLSALGRVPGRRASVETPAADSTSVEAVTLVIHGGTVTPATVRVAKGTRVALTVTNTGASRAELALPGYEERLPAIVIPAGSTWSGQFAADRPGDDFAWMVNGQAAGRFTVVGSHLEEGHR
jgi:FtsP/CotA-like multicopper oxidase with cupredoxin domain